MGTVSVVPAPPPAGPRALQRPLSPSAAQIKHLHAEIEDLQRQTEELTRKCSAIEEREAERRQLDEQKHQEEVAHLKKLNDQLKTNLEGLLSVPKK